MYDNLSDDDNIQILFIIGLGCILCCIVMLMCIPICKEKIPKAKPITRIPHNCNVYSTDGTLLLVQDEALPLLNNI